MKRKEILILGTRKNEDENSWIYDLNSKEDVNYTNKKFSDIEIILNNTGSICKIGGELVEKYDLVYIRYHDKLAYLANAIGILCLSKGIKVVECNKIRAQFTSKLAQTISAQVVGIRIPDTVFRSREFVDESYFKSLESLLGLPFIMKAFSLSKGRGNYLINSFSAVLDAYKSFPDSRFIFQKFIPNDFDFRLVVLGGKLRCVTKRTRSVVGEHRNNTALGGKETYFKPEEVSEKIRNISERMAQLAEYDVAGIDVLVDKETHTPYFLEINYSPGITSNTIESSSLHNYLSSLV